MQDVLKSISWDNTTSEILELIIATVKTRKINKESGNAASVGSFDVVMIGAGPTGLRATYHLQDRAVLLEKNSRVVFRRAVISTALFHDFFCV